MVYGLYHKETLTTSIGNDYDWIHPVERVWKLKNQSHSLERARRGFLGAWTVEEGLVGMTQERKCALSRGNHSSKARRAPGSLAVV